MDLYGIKTCDTCRKARRWLDEAGVNYRWHDLREEGLDRATAEHWLAHVEPHRLINRKSKTWRDLDDAERASADTSEGVLALVTVHPTLVKRPVIDTGEVVLTGFTNDTERTLLELP